ncbi:MAG: hypothetical protein V3U06_09995 [Candidatus Binatia bacterium]
MSATDDVHQNALARCDGFPSLTKRGEGRFSPVRLGPGNARAAHRPTSHPPLPPFSNPDSAVGTLQLPISAQDVRKRKGLEF